MLISKPLPFAHAYLEVLDEQLRRYHGSSRGLKPHSTSLAGVLPEGDEGDRIAVLGAL